jgi:hypothetical protein
VLYKSADRKKLIWTSLTLSRPLRQAQGRLCGTEFLSGVLTQTQKGHEQIQSMGLPWDRAYRDLELKASQAKVQVCRLEAAVGAALAHPPASDRIQSEAS